MAEVSQPQSSHHSPEKLTRVFSRTPSSWDPQDDLLLRHLKEQQKLGWKEIASHFTNRTPNACQFRWRRLRSGSLKSATTATTVTQQTTPGSSSSTSTPSASTASVSTPSTHYKEPSTSPSTSPPPISASALSSSKPRLSTHIAAAASAAAPPSYRQWSFQGSNGNNGNELLGTDPLSSSRNSISSASSSDEQQHQQQQHTHQLLSKLWTLEEDGLLMARRKRSLSFAELSILLPARTEGEISSRINELEYRISSASPSTHTITNRSSIDKEGTKLQYLSTPPQQQRHKRHSHSYHRHSSLSTGIHHQHHQNTQSTPRRKSERSFSVSSQTSSGSINGDYLIRSNSFSITPPVVFNNLQQQAVSERYTLRKESISNINNNLKPFMKSRSNSIFKACLTTSSAIDDDDDDDEEDGGEEGDINNTITGSGNNENALCVDNDDVPDQSKRSLPSLGVLFNDYFAK